MKPILASMWLGTAQYLFLDNWVKVCTVLAGLEREALGRNLLDIKVITRQLDF